MATGNRKSTSGRKKTGTSQRTNSGRKGNTKAKSAPQEDFTKEIVLWVIVAVSLLLFISNFGVGGTIGNAVSRFFFGVFGVFAYIFPIVLLVGTFFAVSNQGNRIATVKLVAAALFVAFLCMFIELVMNGSEIATKENYVIGAYQYAYEYKFGGGIIGGFLAWIFCPNFGVIGSYVIDAIVLIISLVLLTERSALKGMQKGSKKVYESAKISNERHRERVEQRREERELRRMDRKVEGVAIDTRILPETPQTVSDNISEIVPEPYIEMPEIKEENHVTLTSGMPVTEPAIAPSAFSEEAFAALNAYPEAEPAPVELHSSLRPDPSFAGMYTSQEPEMSFAESHSNPEPEMTHAAWNLNPETEVETEFQIGRDVAEMMGNPEIEQSLGQEMAFEPEPEPIRQEMSGASSRREEAFGAGAAVTKSTHASASHAAPAHGAAEEKEVSDEDIAAEIQQSFEVQKPYVFPPVDLLAKVEKKAGDSRAHLQETALKLQQTLKNFGVNVTITNISCGPAVTRYELQPEMGVKVSKIVNLADDIKLNLAATDIRIEAPIPGKAAVGIEVPNKENVMVGFRELIESEEFQKHESRISFCVGKDIGGKVTVADIAKMPHLLIAGATGSGKSVCINTIIMSILYKADPKDVKLIMVDPKVVELSVYNGIPHLMIPVVTDPKKAAGALHWAVAEMDSRYQKFAEVGVRDLKGYNAKIDSLPTIEGDPKPEKLPQIVIIVDELADLMMVAAGDVEESICRLAQLARACGIHLIIATQRPSVNVITGLIKANMPSRIAFAVTSGIDSRTILDMNGAEKLLGKGDMLFNPQGVPKPIRVQGAFVSDKEVSDVVSFLKDQNGSVTYSAEIEEKMNSIESGNTTISIDSSSGAGDGRDAYFADAARLLMEKEKGSIGMLQRYFKVGFNRAARIMDQLEEAGIVGPEEGTKPRRVLMSPEQFEQYEEEYL